MRRSFYWKRLLIAVAVFLVLGGGVYAVHRFQVKSQAGILKERANRAAAQAESDPSKRAEALALLADYLRFRPDDEDAYLSYARLLLAEAKADPSTVERVVAPKVENFLSAFRNHPRERQQLIELYVATAQPTKLALARQHIEVLFDAPTGNYKTDTEVLELAAACEQGLGNLSGAIAHIETAIATDRAPVRTYQRAMELHAADKGDAKRGTYIDAHLSTLRGGPERNGRFAKDLKARVAAARFEMALKNFIDARKDMAEALDHLGGANDPDALLAMADLELLEFKTIEQAKERHEKAEAHLRRAFDLDNKNIPVGLRLAGVLYALGKRDEGVAVLKQTAEALGPIDDLYLMVVDRLIDLGERERAEALVEKVAGLPNKRVMVTYYRGRLAVLKGEWTAALKALEECEPNLIRVPEYHKKALFGLASYYAAMQNPDQQLEYCRRALRDDGRYAPALVGEAEALVRLGRLGDARPRYRAIVNELHLDAYRPELVRLELLDALVQPIEDDKKWARFNESLGQPPEERGPELRIHEANALIVRGKREEAARMLSDWLTAHPTEAKGAAVWVALARIKDGGKPETAAAVLTDAKAKLGDRVEFRLARVALLAARPRPVAPAEFDELAAGTEPFSAADRFRLLLGIGQTAGRVADRGGEADAPKLMRAAALKHLRAAADLMPGDLLCRAVLLDQGLAAGRTDVVEQALKEMAAIEGENGPVGTLGRIAVRLPEVKQVADPAEKAARVKELRALAESVQRQRPGWARIYVALGQLAELEGLDDKALENYVKAIDGLGERQEFVIRRAVARYRVNHQDEKAVALLDKLSTEMRLPDDLERYRSIHKLLVDVLPQNAHEMIERIAPAVREDAPPAAKDYRLQMLRGALLAAIRDDAGALEAFNMAVACPGGEKVPGEGPIPAGEEVAETWGAFVAQLVKMGRTGDAKRAVAEAEKKLTRKEARSPELKAELEDAIGGLYELIGDTKTALEYYRTACRTAREELNPVKQLVLFLQHSDQAPTALELLKSAADDPTPPNIARWARRHLALTLIGRPDAYNYRTPALALVERNLAIDATEPDDLKARATIWTVDPVTREKGVKVLREYGDRGDLTPQEFHLLGRLAFDEGKYSEAEKYFRFGARIRPGVTAEHLAALVRVYVALGALGEADKALERLRANNPGSWEAVREEARLLYRKSKNLAAEARFDEAKRCTERLRAAIVKYPGWDAVANLASRSGPLFDEVGLTADAEAAYKKYLAGSDRADAHVPLALFYILHKRPEEAIALARKHEGKVSSAATAQLLSGAVRMNRPTGDPAPRWAALEGDIEKWLDAQLRAAAGNPEAEAPLIGARAQLWDAQGKYGEAIAEYERCIATFNRVANPRTTNDTAVNNLCMLLALHAPKRADDAEKMMTDLIAIRGPFPRYLDTRAVAYLVSSRPELAIKDLQMALVQYDRAAYHFHLAWALDLDPSKARSIFPFDELRAAKRLGLAAADLHPIEYERYTNLLEKYQLPADDK